MAAQHDLRRILPWWQILLLAISGIIGVTIFSTIGTVLHTASTAGTLIALGIVGFVTICVMASLGELVVLWPVPNALVEYVKYFVDEDLAIVVGVTYWYTWSSVFTVLLIAAYDFMCILVEVPMYRIGILIGVGFCLMVINGLGVRVYGWIEAVGGIVKFLSAVAGGIFLCIALNKQQAASNPAVGYNEDEAQSWIVALCMSIPTLTYGFLGVEIVAVTAFEASDRRSLRWPTRWIAWIMTSLYLFVAIPGTVLINWQDQYLSNHETATPRTTVSRRATPPTLPDSCDQRYSYLVLAAFELGSVAAGKYFDICIIYFCISSANTALYVASRTLYGIFRPLGQGQAQPLPWWQQPRDLPRHLGMLSSRKVPVTALVLSALSWIWLVALRAVKFDVLRLMSTIGCIGGVMVWLIECLAYMKYFAWLQNNHLPDHYARTSRVFVWQRQRPFLSSLQPYVAWCGAIGCFVIGLVLCSAPWWRGNRTSLEILGVYAGPLAMSMLFGGLKIWRRWFARRGAKRAEGREIYKTLEDLSGLPLDKEPRAAEDEEKELGEDLMANIGGQVAKWTKVRQRIQSTETEVEVRELAREATTVAESEPLRPRPRTRVIRLGFEDGPSEERRPTEREI